MIKWILGKLILWYIKRVDKGDKSWVLSTDDRYDIDRTRDRIANAIETLNSVVSDKQSYEKLKGELRDLRRLKDLEDLEKSIVFRKTELKELCKKFDEVQAEIEEARKEVERLSKCQEDERRKIYIDIATQINGGRPVTVKENSDDV